MIEKIKEYYQKNGIPEKIIEQKIRPFADNEDVAAEFEYWIDTHSYKKDNPIKVEGYTAEQIAGISKYLNGESAFLLLIQLRTDPAKAKDKIRKGFYIK